MVSLGEANIRRMIPDHQAIIVRLKTDAAERTMPAPIVGAQGQMS
jgi:hypothetical protein